MTTATITLPFDNRQQSYDRDKLQTAVLVYLDLVGTGTPCPLRADHGLTTDAITHAVGARICVENRIEP